MKCIACIVLLFDCYDVINYFRSVRYLYVCFVNVLPVSQYQPCALLNINIEPMRLSLLAAT